MRIQIMFTAIGLFFFMAHFFHRMVDVEIAIATNGSHEIGSYWGSVALGFILIIAGGFISDKKLIKDEQTEADNVSEKAD